MADTPFVWDDLAQYKAEGRFPGCDAPTAARPGELRQPAVVW
jgi:hypothetical protein